MDSTVKAATPGEESSVAGTIIAAFVSDPPTRWLFPEPHRYFAAMPEFIKAFAGAAFAQGSAYHIGSFSGAALWLPPGVPPDVDSLITMFKRVLPDYRAEAAFALFSQMRAYHPEEPHWYLPLIGVDPTAQSRGYGSALMKHALERCDRDQKLAYLESSNPRNLSLYIRHGFELLGAIRAGDSPPVFPMLRRPQKPR